MHSTFSNITDKKIPYNSLSYEESNVFNERLHNDIKTFAHTHSETLLEEIKKDIIHPACFMFLKENLFDAMTIEEMYTHKDFSEKFIKNLQNSLVTPVYTSIIASLMQKMSDTNSDPSFEKNNEIVDYGKEVIASVLNNQNKKMSGYCDTSSYTIKPEVLYAFKDVIFDHAYNVFKPNDFLNLILKPVLTEEVPLGDIHYSLVNFAFNKGAIANMYTYMNIDFSFSTLLKLCDFLSEVSSPFSTQAATSLVNIVVAHKGNHEDKAPYDMKKALIKEAFNKGALTDYEYYYNMDFETLYQYQDIFFNASSEIFSAETVFNKAVQFSPLITPKSVDNSALKVDYDPIMLAKQKELLIKSLERMKEGEGRFFTIEDLQMLYAHKDILTLYPDNKTAADFFLNAALGFDQKDNLELQKEIIDLALTHGASKNDQFIFGEHYLKILSDLKEILCEHPTHPIHANEFLKQILITSRFQDTMSSPEQEDLYFSLIKYALNHGADPIEINALDFVFDPKSIAFFKEMGSRCSDTFETDINTKKYILGETLCNDPENILFAKYQNVDAPYNEEVKIPFIIHFTLLTQHSFDYYLTTSFFSKMHNVLHHNDESDKNIAFILWVDEYNFTPAQSQFLEKNKVEVRNYKEYLQDDAFLSTIEQYKKNEPGIVEELLSFAVVAQYGGIYNDLSFICSALCTTDVDTPALTHLVHTYDFFAFGNGWRVNSNFFGAKAHHPILEGIIHHYEKYNQSEVDYRSHLQTSLSNAYYHYAHFENNVDVALPIIKGERFSDRDLYYSELFAKCGYDFEQRLLDYERNITLPAYYELAS